jgi:integrase
LAEPNPTHLALRLLILTGVRSAPLRHIHLSQIDGDVWTIPAEAMKGRKGATAAFRVPLSREALRCVELAKPFARDGFLFPGAKAGTVMSDMTLSQHMRRRGMSERPHGFRSSLRDWLAECTDAPHEVAETVLGHVANSKVTRAYLRSDFLEQRRVLMERWADFVTGGAGQVVRLTRREV